MVCILTSQKANYIFRRHLATPLHRAVHAGGPLLLQGPRGSGKTFLLRSEFPRLRHISLSDAADRIAARRDPEVFLARLRGIAFIDDVHRAPELVDYYMRAANPTPMLLASSRKLAIPVTTLTLYQPTRAEVNGRQPVALNMLGHFAPASAPDARSTPSWPTDFPTETQLDGLVQPRDRDRFEMFAKTASEHSGQVLDQQDLARIAGVSRTTATRWLAALEACFLTIRLQPCDLDLGRRLIRAPKLHFIRSTNFESTVVSEICRNAIHAGSPPDLRYWRDSNGMEIELIIQAQGAAPMPVSIVERPGPKDYARLQRWIKLAGVRSAAMVSSTAGHERRSPVLKYTLDQL